MTNPTKNTVEQLAKAREQMGVANQVAYTLGGHALATSILWILSILCLPYIIAAGNIPTFLGWMTLLALTTAMTTITNYGFSENSRINQEFNEILDSLTNK